MRTSYRWQTYVTLDVVRGCTAQNRAAANATGAAAPLSATDVVGSRNVRLANPYRSSAAARWIARFVAW